MKISQCGRSMVEMLGVLAIIGVLSVGSIAGYQKAMMKYKLNKQSESFNLLLSNALQLSISLDKSESYVFYNEMLYKTKFLPDGIKYKNVAGYNSPDQLQDIFGNQIRFFSLHNVFYLSFLLDNTSYSSDICTNIVTIVKEHSSNIIRLLREDSKGGNYKSISIWGDCSKGKCFKNLTLSDISDMCKNSDVGNTSYLFGITWK